MTMTIKLLKHAQWGRIRLYPNCPLSKAVCLIKNTRTLVDDDIEILTKVAHCKIEIAKTKKRPMWMGKEAS